MIWFRYFLQWSCQWPLIEKHRFTLACTECTVTMTLRTVCGQEVDHHARLFTQLNKDTTQSQFSLSIFRFKGSQELWPKDNNNNNDLLFSNWYRTTYGSDLGLAWEKLCLCCSDYYKTEIRVTLGGKKQNIKKTYGSIFACSVIVEGWSLTLFDGPRLLTGISLFSIALSRLSFCSAIKFTNLPLAASSPPSQFPG